MTIRLIGLWKLVFICRDQGAENRSDTILRDPCGDLGLEVYIALTKADSGRGLVAGVYGACIAMNTDRLISAWSRRRKRELGLD